MIFVLTNNIRVEVFRQNCGYQWGDVFQGSRSWNINPMNIMEAEKTGFFAIAKYGTTVGQPCEMLIPVRSVLYIMEPDKWERPEDTHYRDYYNVERDIHSELDEELFDIDD
jgi:hypothetical protein